MNEYRAAYLAGMVDADGHIIWRSGKHNAPSVGITNCDVRLMEWLKANVGGSIGAQRRAGTVGMDGYVHARDIMKWGIVGMRATIVIRAIRPYMIVKRDKADAVLALWEAHLVSMQRPKRRQHHIAKEIAAMRALGWD